MATGEVGVAVLGLGTIGTAVVQAMEAQHDRLVERAGVHLVLQAVLERGPERSARANLPPDVVATDLATILSDDGVDVVVEVLGREQPAADHMARALAAGKHVVTANKEALSKHFGRLVALAHANDRALLFEASVGGGIPLMASLRQVLAANRVNRVRGILNGTTNYILSQMAEQGMAYERALAEAQRLGYAEPDPTADVEGFDASYKLAILASLMAGRQVHPDSVERTGISGVTAAEVEQARARGGAIKLIASAELDGERATLRVAPTFVAGSEMLAHVGANFNAIEIVGDRVGPLVLTGQGAGPLPTASAILSDIVEAARTGVAATPVLG
ncbi:MAG TPA: homoserine dehydrogenase [Thermomicrobiaceae bacterium]|nr:homoserine dehydrogenase [Thermomicrobiaceae bacterium]